MSRVDAEPIPLSPPPVLRAVPNLPAQPPRPANPSPPHFRPDPRRRTPEPLWREVAGAALKERRTRQERTLRQVADRAGISPQYLSEIERGRKEPSSEMLASLCGALGLTLAELLIQAAPGLTGSVLLTGPVLLAA